MNRSTVDLGMILRQAPKFEFDMDTFGGRLRLQKFIYLLQAHGIYLGYDFSWYLRGPYCTGLTTCGFALRDIYRDIPETVDVEFADPDDQLNFERFLKFVEDKETDTNYLEIAASIHILKKTGMAESDIIPRVMAKSKSFTRGMCEQAWDDMTGQGLLPQRAER